MSGTDQVLKLDSPKIALDDVEGHGPHKLALELSKDWLAEVLSKTDATAKSAFSLQVELSEQGGHTYLVRGDLTGMLQVPCARCLSASQVDAGASICVSFVPELTYRQELADMGDVEGDGETLLESDRQPYRGKHLDLAPLLREQILVAYPMRTLCALGGDCAGLCGQCGQDLNAVARGELKPRPCCDGEDPDEAPERSPQQEAWERALRQFGSSSKD